MAGTCKLRARPLQFRVAQPRKLHDRFFKQAKEDGFAARSAYKLQEIQKRKSIIRPGDRVLDLGCAPGSWVQVASQLVGPQGRVVGIDLSPVEIGSLHNARTMVGDIFKVTAQELRELLDGPTSDVAKDRKPPFHVLLSDMAPNTEGGGGRSADHFRSVDLCRRVLQLAPPLLRPSGHLVMKVFEGELYPDLIKDVSHMFRETKGIKPEATRDVSREMFIVAKGYKGGGELAEETPPRPEDVPAKAMPQPRPGWGRLPTEPERPRRLDDRGPQGKKK